MLNTQQTAKRPQLKRDYEALKFDAMVLYIKHGLSAEAIHQQLNISMPTLQKWNNAGRWKELRPDLEIMNQYKASAMFLQKGMSIKDISINLNVPETIVTIWANLFGWHTAKMLSDGQNIASDILDTFCQQLAAFLPNEGTVIYFAKTEYLKSLKPKIDTSNNLTDNH
jgi:transposase